MNANKGNTENQVCESETRLNDVRFSRILENSKNLKNSLREINTISRKKFGELVGELSIEQDCEEKEEPNSWVEKVLQQQNNMYEEISELCQWIDSV